MNNARGAFTCQQLWEIKYASTHVSCSQCENVFPILKQYTNEFRDRLIINPSRFFVDY
jgi:hypothetical protein